MSSSGVLTIFVYKELTRNPEIGILPSKLCSISEDWVKLGIPHMAQMSLFKSYWMLKNTRVTAFTVSEILRENQQEGKITPLPTQIRVNISMFSHIFHTFSKNWIVYQLEKVFLKISFCIFLSIVFISVQGFSQAFD